MQFIPVVVVRNQP